MTSIFIILTGMDFQSLGQQIKHLRSERGMSQQTLADQAGISRVTLAALEAGRGGDVGVRKVMSVLNLLGYELTVRAKSPFPTFEELRDG